MKTTTTLFGFVFIVLFFTTSSFLLKAQEKVTENKTKINFSVKHLGIAVHGVFNPFEANYHCNPKKVSESFINLKIPVKNISTGNKTRDKNLLSDNFFNETRYPFILFTSTSVEKISLEEYRIKGKLTIKGVTKEISIPLKLNFKDEVNHYMILKATVTINRNDYGVGTDYWLAQTCIGNTVTIQSEIKVFLTD